MLWFAGANSDAPFSTGSILRSSWLAGECASHSGFGKARDHVSRLAKAILDGTWRPLSKEALASPVWQTHGKLLETQAALQRLVQTSDIKKAGRLNTFKDVSMACKAKYLRRCEQAMLTSSKVRYKTKVQRGLSIRSSFATGSYAAGGCVKYAGLGSLAYSAAKTFHRFHAAFKSLCIWNAGCVFFTLALCARTAAWSPSST